MKYRKKPVVVEAVQYTGTDASILEIKRFVGEDVTIKTSNDHDRFATYCDGVRENGIRIATLEGTMTASVGDWIIQGVNGEFYPCKPDIFAKTYEPLLQEDGDE